MDDFNEALLQRIEELEDQKAVLSDRLDRLETNQQCREVLEWAEEVKPARPWRKRFIGLPEER